MSCDVPSFSDRGTRVYVGGLNESIKKEDLESHFEKYGKLNDVWVAFNPPGFAFVEFANIDEAESACEALNSAEFMGSRLRVEIARGRNRRGFSDRGGFRGRSSGGFRGGARSRYHSDDYRRGGGGRAGGHFDKRGGPYDDYGSGRAGFRGSRDYRRSASRDRYDGGYSNSRDSSAFRSQTPGGDISSYCSRDNRSFDGPFGYNRSGGGY